MIGGTRPPDTSAQAHPELLEARRVATDGCPEVEDRPIVSIAELVGQRPTFLQDPHRLRGHVQRRHAGQPQSPSGVMRQVELAPSTVPEEQLEALRPGLLQDRRVHDQ